MRFQHIIEAVYYHPWFITAPGYLSVRRITDRRIFGLYAPGENVDLKGQIDLSQVVNQRPAMSVDSNRIAHIYICGVLAKNLSPIEKSCGNTDYGDVQREIMAAKLQGARGAQFYFNSPGGKVAACAETMQAIDRAGIPTVASIDEQCTSAAQFLACACDRIYAPASALVGSLACILPWVDESKAWDMEGLKFEPITNDGADLKGAGAGPSLTPDQRKCFVQFANDQFATINAIMLQRRTISGEVYRGGIMAAPRALENNLIDAIGGEDEAYADLYARIAQA